MLTLHTKQIVIIRIMTQTVLNPAIMPKFILFILICTSLQIFTTAPLSAQNSDVMMQGFNWNSATNASGWYNVVNANVAEMKAGGINTIWLPPPGKSAAREGYLPSEY